MDPSSPKLKQFFTRLNDDGDFILKLSDNSLGVFQSCNRAAQYYIQQCRRSSKSGAALSYGDAWHKFQEIRTRCKSNDEQLWNLVSQVISKHFEDNPVDPDEWRTGEYLLECAKKYHKQYTPELLETVKTPSGELMCELTFNLPLGTIEVNGTMYLDRKPPSGPTDYVRTIFVEWNGRIDDIINLDGMYWVRDYKTTSMGGPTYFEEFKMAGQPVGYAWAAKTLAPQLPISGFMLDCAIMRKPTKTGKGAEFQRQRYPYSDEKLNEWQCNTMSLIGDMVANFRANDFPMRTKSCVGKYGKCPYFDVCTLPQRFRQDFLMGPDYGDCLEKNPE